MYAHGMLAPVVALLAWSFIMLLWLYFTRIPAMQRAKMNPNTISKADLETLPDSARNPAANYNHLMEQPTLFYAACFALQLLGQGDQPINIGIAWAYVGLRIVHSLVQATANIITVRFFLFALASIALGALIFHAAMAMLSS